MEGIEAIDRSVLHSHLIRVMQEVIFWKGLIPTVFFNPLLHICHILVVVSKETNLIQLSLKVALP